MSEHDEETDPAEEESESPAADSTADAPDGQDATEALSEIAAEPAGDVEAELAEIVEGAETATGTGDSAAQSPGDGPQLDETFVEEIEATDPRTVAEAIALLREEVGRLETALGEQRERADDLESRLKRKQADFQNYKKRQEQRMEDEMERATEDLVTRLLEVRDNLERALEQDEDADIRGGVESTLEQFDHELDRENVTAIEPEPGQEVDPTRHEVLATITSEQPADSIAEVHRPGYEMAGKILRPAQVAVSDDE